MQGEEYTQQTYFQKANAFKQQWLQSHPEVNATLQVAIQVLSGKQSIKAHRQP